MIKIECTYGDLLIGARYSNIERHEFTVISNNGSVVEVKESTPNSCYRFLRFPADKKFSIKLGTSMDCIHFLEYNVQ
jgi:hypothetical protein